MDWKYIERPEQALKTWYNTKVREGISGFENFEDFKDWYSQEKVCHYCGLTEVECQEIVHKGILTSNRFPLNGIFARGVNRGYWLEFDRKQPKGKYSRENCVLSCYFCNNDKSDVFTDSQYIEFKKDRVGFLKSLLKNE